MERIREALTRAKAEGLQGRERSDVAKGPETVARSRRSHGDPGSGAGTPPLGWSPPEVKPNADHLGRHRIVAYAERAGLERDMADMFVLVIRAMDQAYLGWHATEAEKRRNVK